jgi:NH3-dependent NAD+ synthetase
LVTLVEEYSLVGFYTLCVDDKESIVNIIRAIDKANGYVFGADQHANESIFQTALRIGVYDDVRDVQEKYMQSDQDVNE